MSKIKIFIILVFALIISCDKGFSQENKAQECAWGFILDESSCYNSKTTISYYEDKSTGVRSFHTKDYMNAGNIIYGNYCGTDCDLDGKNCKTGFCNQMDCPIGYGLLIPYQVDGEYNSGGYCYNPSIKLAYSKDEKFYKVKKKWGLTQNYYYLNYCGANCDKKGKNCKVGKCRSMF